MGTFVDLSSFCSFNISIPVEMKSTAPQEMHLPNRWFALAFECALLHLNFNTYSGF